MRGRDRDLVRPWKTGGARWAGIVSGDSDLPASADATLGRNSGRLPAASSWDACLQHLCLPAPKMLTPALTYINCDAKPGKS